MSQILPVSIVIPTFGRDGVLVDTITMLLELPERASEIILVDQTPHHDEATVTRLTAWDTAGQIRHLRLSRPSIPAAMNMGLKAAREEIVLFLDDDIVPQPNLIRRHIANYADPAIVGVVGQVLQPGQDPTDRLPAPARAAGLHADLGFPFNSTQRGPVRNCMAGNLSVRRAAALRVGGLDENFVGVAYRFETEFARRLVRRAGLILFDGQASIRHLQAPRGGTRAYGDPLRSASPFHGVGDYYFAMREGGSAGEIAAYFLKRLSISLGRKLYLREFWWLPVKLLGEIRAMRLALALARTPARLVEYDGTA